MSPSEPFIFRPVGTALLTLAVFLAGLVAYQFLPVAALPQIDFPTVSVSAGLPGASPETMASSVATPLERQFGRIAGVAEMTSASYLGQTSITLQFDLDRDINAAARDVQAAINAAAGQLPSYLPAKPSYRKVNPADAPILIMTLTSDIYDKAHMYDSASSVLQQKLSQIDGVGQVIVGGGALPAVRVEVNQTGLNNAGLSLEELRAALTAANANTPKGRLSDGRYTYTITATDQLFKAREYQSLVVAYRHGAPVRLSDVATVVDGIENIHTAGLSDGKPAIAIIVFRQPGANIIETVDRVRAEMPQLQASIPTAMNLNVILDRTDTIRASVRDTEFTLLISVCLVIAVVFLFLRDWRSTLIPGIAVPVSLTGTLGILYLGGYSIDNLSLMALTIATGFVVDDAIVVTENITRHREMGLSPLDAALKGAKEIGFTVLSMSLSLVAVFAPIMLLGGMVGRMFREFAVTLSAAIAVSLVVSLTTTPMMCATLMRPKSEERHGRLYRASEAGFNGVLFAYETMLGFVLQHKFVTLLVWLSTIVLTVLLYIFTPQGLFPPQDTGRLSGTVKADQAISSQAMQKLMAKVADATARDPAVQHTVAFTPGGGGTINQGSMFVTLKPLEERKLSADQVNDRLRKSLAGTPGAEITFVSVPDLRAGGRVSAGLYQYTLQGESLSQLMEVAPRVLQKMANLPGLADVNSDQQSHGLEADLIYDRDTAAKLGLTTLNLDNTLYDAFGQRQVSTMYTLLNQYHVVMEVAPTLSEYPESYRMVYAGTASNTALAPLPVLAQYKPSTMLLSVAHQGQYPSVTISFNLKDGMSLGPAVDEIEQALREMVLPAEIHGGFAGTAQAFQSSTATYIILVLAALMAVYIVLGILYESYIHPLTIISTLPSAGMGALLALRLWGTELNVIGLIGIILLIGIVKKNAILMIDFALDAERKEGKPPEEAILQACLLRFRPIMMTTMTALLGGLPLVLGTGLGSELRRPLGITIIGGLIVSQALTLFTTPVVYLYADRIRLWSRAKMGVKRREVIAEGNEA